MADSIAFQNALAEALEKRRDWLDRTELPRLKEEYRLLHSSFSGLHALLLKKGILHEDPYRNDSKIGDVQIPDRDDMQRSREILEDLRNRANDPRRSPGERDYIRRLLQFY